MVVAASAISSSAHTLQPADIEVCLRFNVAEADFPDRRQSNDRAGSSTGAGSVHSCNTKYF